MAALQAGGLLARRYRLIDRIGAGGMSVIWRARDEVLDRVVAVKVLAASLAADTKFREMVREEARAAAQLVHPHVTAVHDYGETAGPDGGITAFVVMELLTGEELKAELTAGPLPWMTAVEICAQVAEALAAAHRLGIVHRDITPANIMMTATGAKVLDFGIATRVGAPDEDEDGETFGTPAYVAPERLDGLPAQPATDTYSLGVLLYETLAGRVPFPADTWDELSRVMQAGTEPTLTGVPDLPAVVADICLRCLARDPVERPTAAQVAETLRGQLLAADPRRTLGGHQPRPRTIPTARLTALPAPAAGPSATALAPAAPSSVAGDSAATGRSGADRSGTPDPAPVDESAPDPSMAPGSVTDLLRGQGSTADRPEPPRPGRVLIFAAATLVVLTAAVVIASALGGEPRSRPSGGSSTAGPDATPPMSPSPGIPATTPVPTRSTVLPTLPGSSDDTAPPVSEAMTRLDQLVDDGVAASAIRDHAGVDLRNQLRNLRAGLAAGPTDLARQVTQLREKVTVRRNEGSISPEYAEQLDAALVRLAAAV